MLCVVMWQELDEMIGNVLRQVSYDGQQRVVIEIQLSDRADDAEEAAKEPSHDSTTPLSGSMLQSLSKGT